MSVYSETFTCTYSGIKLNDKFMEIVDPSGSDSLSLTLEFNSLNDSYYVSFSGNSLFSSTDIFVEGDNTMEFNNIAPNASLLVGNAIKSNSGFCPEILIHPAVSNIDSNKAILRVYREGYYDGNYTVSKDEYNEYSGTKSIVDDKETSYEVIESCTPISFSWYAGSYEYSIIKEAGIYYYEFKGMNRLEIGSSNPGCKSSSDFKYCKQENPDGAGSGANSSGYREAGILYSGQSCDDYYDEQVSVGTPDTSDFSSPKDCVSLLGSVDDEGSTAYYLQIILDVMRYSGIAAVIVLTIMDYLKALASNDTDNIKKTSSRTFKRIILAVAIFLAPIIINYVFELTGITTGASCDIS